MRLIFIVLIGMTGALYLAIVFWSLPLITIEADGLTPFDLRPFGYSVEAAEEFNNALSDEGRVFYLQTQHWLDTFFPAVLAATLIWSAVLLWDGVWRWAMIALAMTSAAADYLENATVARLLMSFDPALAIEASRWTILKSASGAIVFVAILALFGRRLWARYRG